MLRKPITLYFTINFNKKSSKFVSFFKEKSIHLMSIMWEFFTGININKFNSKHTGVFLLCENIQNQIKSLNTLKFT